MRSEAHNAIISRTVSDRHPRDNPIGDGHQEGECRKRYRVARDLGTCILGLISAGGGAPGLAGLSACATRHYGTSTHRRGARPARVTDGRRNAIECQ